MLRQVLITISMFVLMWTSTFLHDVFENDQPTFHLSAGHIHTLPCNETTFEDSASENHCHDVLIASKNKPILSDLPYMQAHTMLAAIYGLPVTKFVCRRLCDRGPPFYAGKASLKLYLLNRSLLI